MAERVVVTALTAADAAVPGEILTIMWRFDLAAGWHLYSNYRNDSGFPPAVKLDLPAGWLAGPLLWPVPERYLSAGEILDHVYHGQLLLLQELTVPSGAVIGQTVAIPARLDWLVCRDECVPGQAHLELKILVAERGQPSAEAQLFAAARAALPRPAPLAGCEIHWSDSSVEIVVPDAANLEFFPAVDCVRLSNIIADGSGSTDRLVLGLRSLTGGPGPLKGVLHQQVKDGSVRNWIIDAQPGG